MAKYKRGEIKWKSVCRICYSNFIKTGPEDSLCQKCFDNQKLGPKKQLTSKKRKKIMANSRRIIEGLQSGVSLTYLLK